ncbi:GntR family transcriptional regulator [Microvirga sp. KLBC 81]|uniref:MocR-like pyridoxine biosynthesis transcription factor PdxR n=1 Tax=Microvirga sp. KLBC 81 TaxID=1862707 RepID=UPI000D5252F5|nr:PLP-dependent aminotransferase family protein [Microvirga sp. KLBC 81]PVE22012.1 GntR family transcriptional regulator [Microvirga sp. KLBC 81]
MNTLPFSIDRDAKASLSSQIYTGLRDAIHQGTLTQGARLPSWRDLAVQLGVSRGTVRVVYERLLDEQLLVSRGAGGTWVSEAPIAPRASPERSINHPFPDFFPDFSNRPATFQMGVPSQDAFPFKLWTRMMLRNARTAALHPVSYPDPRGAPALRQEIASYLAIARGLQCTADQVLVTAGFAGAIGIAVRALKLEGASAWFEDPGFPLTRKALQIAGLNIVPVPVDGEGLDVRQGISLSLHAALAVVTPGQQAPLGMTMTLARRRALLDWAARHEAYIIEDDYLGELQLRGRAAPALASIDQDRRVLHIGTFSKTISPSLRLGFAVVPSHLALTFAETAACLAPAPNVAVQHTVAEFIREGHYLRHLRKMKRLYAALQQRLADTLRELAPSRYDVDAHGGFAVRLILPDYYDDVAVSERALQYGLAPVPLSPWYLSAPAPRGLLLGATNYSERTLRKDCIKLLELVEASGGGRREQTRSEQPG